MDFFQLFIYFIVLVKIVFVGSTLYLRYLKKKNNKNDSSKISRIQNIKDQTEFIFVASMSLLLILLFSPITAKFYFQRVNDYETRLLLFLYGIIMIIEADWSTFLKNV